MSRPSLSAFDPGTRLMGWCSGAGESLPTVGTWRWPQVGDDLGQMLEWLDDALESHVNRFKPAHIVYEKPILVVNARFTDRDGVVRHRTDKLDGLRKTYNLGGHIEFFCRRRGIAYNWVDLHDVKKELAGASGADKEAMVWAARKVGLVLPAGDAAKDAADAFGAWLLLLRHHSPHLGSRFDAALWGRRGVLI